MELRSSSHKETSELHNNTMATVTMQTVTIPRFLLPQLTWSSMALKRAGPMGAVAFPRYMTSSNAGQPSNASQQRRAFSQGSLISRNKAWASIRTPAASSATAILRSRREFSATASHARDHHFDTLKFVQRLKDEGFTEEQAEAMMRVLSDVIEERWAAS